MGVGFVPLPEASDLITPSGWPMAGLLAIFVEVERESWHRRVRAGMGHARRGIPHGRPPTVCRHAAPIGRLFAEGLSKRAIARQQGIRRMSVRRMPQAISMSRGDGTPTVRDTAQAEAEGGPK